MLRLSRRLRYDFKSKSVNRGGRALFNTPQLALVLPQNHHTLRSPPRQLNEFLAFTKDNVWRIPLANELVGTQLLSNISSDSGSIVADCAEHNLYWNSMSTGIRRSQYDGSDNQLVLPQSTGNLESVSLDGGPSRLISAQGESGKQMYGITVSSSRIYWTTLRTGSINSLTKTGADFKATNFRQKPDQEPSLALTS
ncbi:hypothetical protein BV898_18601 [Hypsibius exemplaris]|uniref:Uncharacterized protein n=1 Tax=Hypsibius exemplaris TaxID=2072580 RepID=A0A9X6NK98_HYPEX|nr:hypothetical protein BV898_18601 [Hypsibius exemplaris]